MTVTAAGRGTRSASLVRAAPGRLNAWLIAALLVLGLAIPTGVSAHAALDTITPADNSSGPAPTEIVGTFIERPDPAKSSFAVVDPAGKVVVKGGTVPAGNARSMTLALPALAPGAYEIRWTTISLDDGETAHGITSFAVVAAASPSPSVAPSAVAPSQSAAVPSAVASASAPPTPAPSATPAPASSTTDALIPIVAVVILVAVAAGWLLRGRSRAGR